MSLLDFFIITSRIKLGNAFVRAEKPAEGIKLGAIRQSAEKQKIYSLFKAETIVRHKAVDKLADIYSAIIQLACARNERSVRLLLLCYYLGDLGKSGKNSVSADIAQSALNRVFIVERGVNLACLPCLFCKRHYLRCQFRKISCIHNSPFSVTAPRGNVSVKYIVFLFYHLYLVESSHGCNC